VKSTAFSQDGCKMAEALTLYDRGQISHNPHYPILCNRLSIILHNTSRLCRIWFNYI